jgi:DNA-binding response OmpR family regulator
VAEDEALISFDIETLLKEAGANVVAAIDQRDRLLAAAVRDLTAGVLDVKLGQQSIDPICESLDRRCVPFLFLTEDSGTDAQKWASAPILSKAFDPQVLIDSLVRLLVTGGDTLANESHMDRVVFRAAIRLARQERLIGDLAQQQDPRAAGSLLRIMRESLELLQAHRLRLIPHADETMH